MDPSCLRVFASSSWQKWIIVKLCEDVPYSHLSVLDLETQSDGVYLVSSRVIFFINKESAYLYRD